MKKIKEKNKYIFAYGISFVLAGIVLYPLLDVILCKFITHSEFVYSFYEHVVKPVSFGIIMTLFLYMAENGFKFKK